MPIIFPAEQHGHGLADIAVSEPRQLPVPEP